LAALSKAAPWPDSRTTASRISAQTASFRIATFL
jgi:hypothetical protein